MNSLTREVTMNAAVCIPEPIWSLPPFGWVVTTEWSFHALNEAAKDNFWNAPPVVKLHRDNVVEVTVMPQANGAVKVTKLVVRVPSPDKNDHDRDMVVVLEPRQGSFTNGAYVKTCYANHKEDRHITLDIERVAGLELANRVAGLLA